MDSSDPSMPGLILPPAACDQPSAIIFSRHPYMNGCNHGIETSNLDLPTFNLPVFDIEQVATISAANPPEMNGANHDTEVPDQKKFKMRRLLFALR